MKDKCTDSSYNIIKALLLLLLICILLPLAFFLHAPYAQQIQVLITADRTNVMIGEQIQVLVSVQGTRNIPQPDFPATDAYEVHYRGQSSKFEIINGQISSSLDFNYILIPKKVGEIRIPPVSVKVGGKRQYSQPLTINVSASPNSSHLPESEKNVFITTQVDDTEAFVNQQILYTLKFYRAVKIRGASLEPINFEGFLAERLGKEREYSQILNGKKYVITEVRFALFPQRSGTLTITPAKINCQLLYKNSRRSRGFPFDSFFDNFSYDVKNELLTSEPLTINVSPLPALQNPSLATPLVGTFHITADLNPKDIKVGESSTLTITISGAGNVDSIPDPQIEDMEDFKLYEDKPQVDKKITLDGISGTKSFKRAIVPTKPGNFTIPAIKLPYLDPDTGKYKISATKPISISVKPGSEEESLNLLVTQMPSVKKEEIRLIGKDILPPKTTIAALKDQTLRLRNLIILLSLILPPLAFCTVFLIEKKKRHIITDRAYYRRKNAFKKWKIYKKGIHT